MAASDFTPLYVHVSRMLRGQILDGVYATGDAIPSESELVAKFRTTRGTVRSAVDVLVSEGLVRRLHGRGSFVQFQPIRHSTLNFGSLTDSLRGRAETPVSRVVTAETVVLDGLEHFRLVRLRGIRAAERVTLLSLDTALICLDRFPGIAEIDFEDRSLYETFRERYGVFPRRTQVTLTTHLPDEGTRRLLGEDQGQALLMAEGRAFDEDDLVVERLRILYSSRVQFNLTTAISEIPGVDG